MCVCVCTHTHTHFLFDISLIYSTLNKAHIEPLALPSITLFQIATEVIACSNFKGDHKNKENTNEKLCRSCGARILQPMSEISNTKTRYLSGIEYFGLAQNKNSNDRFYLHPFPISTLMLKWPPHITTINTRKPHLGGKKKKKQGSNKNCHYSCDQNYNTKYFVHNRNSDLSRLDSEM